MVDVLIIKISRYQISLNLHFKESTFCAHWL